MVPFLALFLSTGFLHLCVANPIAQPWPAQWRGTASYLCVSSPEFPCFSDPSAPKNDVTTSFNQFYDYIRKTHRVDHNPRCFPFTEFGEEKDSAPCTIWFTDSVYYDNPMEKFCCVMAKGVPLLHPNWTFNASFPDVLNYTGVTIGSNHDSVNGWGPYPTDLFYYETVNKSYMEPTISRWTSVPTLLDMLWFERLEQEPSWWAEYMTIPSYCDAAPTCEGISTNSNSESKSVISKKF